MAWLDDWRILMNKVTNDTRNDVLALTASGDLLYVTKDGVYIIYSTDPTTTTFIDFCFYESVRGFHTFLGFAERYRALEIRAYA